VGLYDRYLATRIRLSDGDLPETVAVVISEHDLLVGGAYETLGNLLEWAFEYGASTVIVYVSVVDEETVPTIRRQLESVRSPRPIAVRTPEDEAKATEPVQISIGLGGKHEFAAAVRAVAEEVQAGRLAPEQITQDDIERELVFQTAPDLVIKTGAERLSDFMIWQSVYSELYFTDVNWQNFRKREYLRALRDFQDRKRRFGS